MKTKFTIKQIQAMVFTLNHLYYQLLNKSFHITILDSGYLISGNFSRASVIELYDYEKMVQFFRQQINSKIKICFTLNEALSLGMENPMELLQVLSSNEFFQLCDLKALAEVPPFMNQPIISGKQSKSFWAFNDDEEYRIISLQVVEN